MACLRSTPMQWKNSLDSREARKLQNRVFLPLCCSNTEILNHPLNYCMKTDLISRFHQIKKISKANERIIITAAISSCAAFIGSLIIRGQMKNDSVREDISLLNLFFLSFLFLRRFMYNSTIWTRQGIFKNQRK